MYSTNMPLQSFLEKERKEFEKFYNENGIVIDWSDPEDMLDWLRSHDVRLIKQFEKTIEDWGKNQEGYLTMMQSKKEYEKGVVARELKTDLLLDLYESLCYLDSK